MKRELGLFGVFSVAAGAMISSGIFVLPSLAFDKAGPSAILAYALASILMLPVLFSQTELVTAMPRSGGSYFFIERSLGPLVGTIAGFSNWLSIAFKAGFALVGIGALAQWLFPEVGQWGIRITASVACFFFMALNLMGTKKAALLQNTLVAFLLVILGGYVFYGLGHLEESHYHNFMPKGIQNTLGVAGMVFVSYGGLTKVAAVAEEIRDPRRNLPLGMFLASGVVNLLYVLAVLVTVGVASPEALTHTLTPLALAAETLVGRWGGIVLSAAAFLAFATTANSGILSASRAPMAMSRDGLLPGALAKTHPRRGTPIPATLITCFIIITLILALDLENLVKTASTMMLLMFALVNLSVIIMRGSRMQNYRPSFRSPLYPWLQIGAIGIYGFLIFEMGWIPLLITGLFILGAMTWYFSYVHLRIERESALVYLVKRALSRHLERSRLDQELVDIVLERDNVALDRFDHLVRTCPILDIKESIGAKDLFRRVSEILASRLPLKKDQLFDLFLEREAESSTVVETGLAIPHVVVPGNHIFDMVMVRCKQGVVFSELNQPVHTLFVLIGSVDERNFHLKALMNIARIVQSPDFESRWLGPSDPAHLRDAVMLAERGREEE